MQNVRKKEPILFPSPGHKYIRFKKDYSTLNQSMHTKPIAQGNYQSQIFFH